VRYHFSAAFWSSTLRRPFPLALTDRGCATVILLGLFYGVFADRYGRRRALALNIFSFAMGTMWVQMICMLTSHSSHRHVCWSRYCVLADSYRHIVRWPQVFPVRLTWLSTVFYLVGGGPLLSNSLLYLIIADVMPAEKRLVVASLHSLAFVDRSVFC
jgi:MFS family permease